MVGLPPNVIVTETKSENTHDHAVNLCPFLQEQQMGRVLLVTSAMHMPRSVAVFRRVCPTIEFVPAPTDFRAPFAPSAAWYRRGVALLPTPRSLLDFSDAAHEFLGMLYYRLRGWTWRAADGADVVQLRRPRVPDRDGGGLFAGHRRAGRAAGASSDEREGCRLATSAREPRLCRRDPRIVHAIPERLGWPPPHAPFGTARIETAALGCRPGRQVRRRRRGVELTARTSGHPSLRVSGPNPGHRSVQARYSFGCLTSESNQR